MNTFQLVCFWLWVPLQELGCENCLLVDFWEAILMASSQEAVIQELLFRLTSVYIERLTSTSLLACGKLPPQRRRPLKTAEDLVQCFQTDVQRDGCFLHWGNESVFQQRVRN